MIFRPGLNLSDDDIRKIASIVPGCTVNMIKNSQVERKLRLQMPAIIEGLEETHCKNDACISHPDHAEQVPPEFIKA